MPSEATGTQEATVKRAFPALILVASILSCVQQAPGTSNERDAAVEKITGLGIRAHMEVLAADDMEGREAGTAGFERAAEYVAGEFRSAGLVPLGDEGSYFQKINFFETRLVPESAIISFSNGSSRVDLIFRDDFVRSGGFGEGEEQITAPLVFVGHGIIAPEYDHDDYEGVDVQGKILVVLSGAPPQFATDQRAFYSSGSGKRMTAVERGAVGMIGLRTPVDQKRRSWARYLPGIGSPGMRWLDPAGKPHHGFPELAGSAALSEAGAAKLFDLSKHDLSKIFEKHAAGETGSFEMGVTAALGRKSIQRKVSSANVVGLLKGSDSTLQDEYIVYTAHLDHIGIRPGKDGDDIHNGAYDNSAGVASVLEIAKAMAAMEKSPRRSIIFALVTGEEKGLQGSSYFARTPPVSAEKLVANLNIDMPYLGFPVSDIEAFGAEHSTLRSSVLEATAAMDMELTPDPMPEQVRFVRSDQFSFVKEGIPALAFKAGSKSSDPKIDGSAMLSEFLKNHYHQASDDLALPFSPEGAQRFVRAALLLGLIVADKDESPEWNEDDFFGDMFAR
jgi:Zn-dependent M28 family amino/carboxypeptidase